MSYILDSLKESEKDRGSFSSSFRPIASLPPKSTSQTKISWRQCLFVLISGVFFFAIVIFLIKNSWVVFETIIPLAAKPDSVVSHVVGAEKIHDVSAKFTINPASSTPIKSYVKKIEFSSVESLYQEAERSQGSKTNVELKEARRPAAPLSNHELSIPTFDRLEFSMQQSIPTVRYEAHIFSSDAQNGFVIFNGTKYHAGDRIDRDFYLEKIFLDQSLLSYEGRLFLVKAMKNF